MEYVLGLFADKESSERVAEVLRQLGLDDDDFHIRTHSMATQTLKGWIEWLFGMPEPLSGMEGEGVPHDAAHWYEDRVDAGETMVAARTGNRRGVEIARALRRAGGHDIHRYEKRAEGWTRFTGEDTG